MNQDVAPHKPVCPHCRARLLAVERNGKVARQEFDDIVYILMMCSSCRSSFTVIESNEETESLDIDTAPPYKTP